MTVRPTVRWRSPRALTTAGSSARRTRASASRAMSAPRRQPARSSPIPTATASPTPTGSITWSAQWRRKASPPAAGQISRQRRRAWCPRRSRCRQARRATYCSTTRSPSTLPAATWPSAAPCCSGSAGLIRSFVPPAAMSTSAWGYTRAGTRAGTPPPGVVWHFRRNTVQAYIGQQKGYGKAEALVYGKHPQRFNAFGQAKWSGRIYGDLSASMLLWRKPLIYSGTFGRGLFQTLYQPPASIFQYLPLTFEWTALSLALSLAGLVGEVARGGWWWLLILPLVLTWAMCLKGGLSAKIAPRF